MLQQEFYHNCWNICISSTDFPANPNSQGINYSAADHYLCWVGGGGVCSGYMLSHLLPGTQCCVCLASVMPTLTLAKTWKVSGNPTWLQNKIRCPSFLSHSVSIFHNCYFWFTYVNLLVNILLITASVTEKLLFWNCYMALVYTQTLQCRWWLVLLKPISFN